MEILRFADTSRPQPVQNELLREYKKGLTGPYLLWEVPGTTARRTDRGQPGEMLQWLVKAVTRGLRTYMLTAVCFRHGEQRHRTDGGNAVSHPVDRLDVRDESKG